MKQNKKNGFVVSAVLYPLLILFLALIMGLLSMSDTRKRILDKMKLEISDSVFDEATCSCDTILNKLNYLIKNGVGGGGGGGWYGGGGSYYAGGGGGGGSSYISGHAGCIGVSNLAVPNATEYTTLSDSYSYTGYKFSDTVMIDGMGYNWTTEKGEYVGMPQYDGVQVMEGNTGNGFAKITWLGTS